MTGRMGGIRKLSDSKAPAPSVMLMDTRKKKIEANIRATGQKRVEKCVHLETTFFSRAQHAKHAKNKC